MRCPCRSPTILRVCSLAVFRWPVYGSSYHWLNVFWTNVNSDTTAPPPPHPQKGLTYLF